MLEKWAESELTCHSYYSTGLPLNMFSKLSAALIGALLAQTVASHPGHDHSAEIAARDAYLNQASRRLISGNLIHQSAVEWKGKSSA